MENKLVRYSRAGDAFHYRWAARRCLRMVHPKSQVNCISIEGSKENRLAGEYSIDVAEYVAAKNGKEDVTYFQLKHSTKRVAKDFTLSDLKDTLEEFAKRHIAFCGKSKKRQRNTSVRFAIVTNRRINSEFRNGIDAIQRAKAVNARFRVTLEKYTKLKNNRLRDFCVSLAILDREGNYAE